MRELKRDDDANARHRPRRTPHGVRELQPAVGRESGVPEGRTPHGVRELKRDGDQYERHL